MDAVCLPMIYDKMVSEAMKKEDSESLDPCKFVEELLSEQFMMQQ